MANEKVFNSALDHFFGYTFPDVSGIYDDMLRSFSVGGYPPYDLEQVNDETIKISIAVAGLNKDDIDVFVDDNILHIKYDKKESAGEEFRPKEITGVSEVLDESSSPIPKGISKGIKKIIRKGIARRNFHLKFRVVNISDITAKMDNGILEVLLQREMPQAKMTKIEIQQHNN